MSRALYFLLVWCVGIIVMSIFIMPILVINIPSEIAFAVTVTIILFVYTVACGFVSKE